MNQALHRLAADLALEDPRQESLRLRFGLACAERVRHLLEQPGIIRCLDGLAQFVSGQADRAALASFADEAGRIANHHHGSRSIDGCGHAAVSATYAVANALAGKAVQAADYAAYAVVYAQGGYGAVCERESFEPEYRWQVDRLASLSTPR